MKNLNLTDLKPGDNCWVYGIGDAVVQYATDDTILVLDGDNKFVFSKHDGCLNRVQSYTAEMMDSQTYVEMDYPMLFHSIDEFAGYWSCRMMGGDK